MELVKQLLLALGVMTSPLDHPPEPCLDHCHISDVGRALVRNFEGYSPFRYRDSAGLWTIGVGHLIRPGEHFDEPLLGDAAEALFQKDLAPKVAGSGQCACVSAASSRAVRCRRVPGLQHRPTVSLDVIYLVASSCGYYRAQIEPHTAQ